MSRLSEADGRRLVVGVVIGLVLAFGSNLLSGVLNDGADGGEGLAHVVFVGGPAIDAILGVVLLLDPRSRYVGAGMLLVIVFMALLALLFMLLQALVPGLASA